jgi:hypothetical protein
MCGYHVFVRLPDPFSWFLDELRGPLAPYVRKDRWMVVKALVRGRSVGDIRYAEVAIEYARWMSRQMVIAFVLGIVAIGSDFLYPLVFHGRINWTYASLGLFLLALGLTMVQVLRCSIKENQAFLEREIS